MAVEPQVALPVAIEDRDPNVPGSGTPVNAASIMPNFEALADVLNTHTHDEYALAVDVTAGLNAESAARTAADALKLNIANPAATGALTFDGDATANLKRYAASILRTDATIIAGPGNDNTQISFGGITVNRSGAANNVLLSRVVADVNSRFAISTDGKHQWGDGTNAVDTNVYRAATDSLKTDDNFTVGLNLLLRGSASSIVLDAAASATQTAYASRVSGNAQAQHTVDIAGRHAWGDGVNAVDTSLYRASSGMLQTDSQFTVSRVFINVVGTVSNSAFNAKLNTDTAQRMQVMADGKLQWGDGTNGQDVTLYRSAADTLKSDDLIHSQRGATNQGAFQASLVGDPFARLFISADGKMQWSSGALAPDTNLYRSSAGVLKTDQSILALGSLSSNPSSSTSSALSASVAADAVARYVVRADGQTQWGDGTNARDTFLTRVAVGRLALGSATQLGRLDVYGSAATDSILSGRVGADANGRLFVSADGKHLWGDGTNNPDMTLHRVSSTEMRFTGGGLSIVRTGSGFAFGVNQSGDTNSRIYFDGSGSMQFGPGNAAQDVTLARTNPGQLQLTNRLSINNSAIGTALSTIVNGDTNSRWFIGHDGGMGWGPGNAAQDVTLYRAGVDILKTDDSFQVGSLVTLEVSGAIALKERTDPANAAADSGRLYLRDNGAGKTQLCVIFNTGTPIVLATQA